MEELQPKPLHERLNSSAFGEVMLSNNGAAIRSAAEDPSITAFLISVDDYFAAFISLFDDDRYLALSNRFWSHVIEYPRNFLWLIHNLAEHRKTLIELQKNYESTLERACFASNDGAIKKGEGDLTQFLVDIILEPLSRVWENYGVK